MAGLTSMDTDRHLKTSVSLWIALVFFQVVIWIVYPHEGDWSLFTCDIFSKPISSVNKTQFFWRHITTAKMLTIVVLLHFLKTGTVMPLYRWDLRWPDEDFVYTKNSDFIFYWQFSVHFRIVFLCVREDLQQPPVEADQLCQKGDYSQNMLSRKRQ